MLFKWSLAELLLSAALHLSLPRVDFTMSQSFGRHQYLTYANKTSLCDDIPVPAVILPSLAASDTVVPVPRGRRVGVISVGPAVTSAVDGVFCASVWRGIGASDPTEMPSGTLLTITFPARVLDRPTDSELHPDGRASRDTERSVCAASNMFFSFLKTHYFRRS